MWSRQLLVGPNQPQQMQQLSQHLGFAEHAHNRKQDTQKKNKKALKNQKINQGEKSTKRKTIKKTEIYIFSD